MTVALNTTLKSAPWSSTWQVRASSALTADFTSDAQPGVDRFSAAIIHFKSAAAVGGTSPTLNCYVQTLLPDNSTWCDIVSFPQVTSSALDQTANVVSSGNSIFTVTTGTLAANTVRTMPLGHTWRVFLDVGGTSPSFVCQVEITFIE